MPMDTNLIKGQGGGKKSRANNSDDTLSSKARALVIDAISEGPIVGLVDGANSVYLNRTAISNFEESNHQQRLGNPDDAPVAGFTGTEAYQNVGVEIAQKLGDQIRTVLDTDTDVVRLYMSQGQLYRVNDKGALRTTDGGWRVDVRPAGGAWTRAITFDLNGEKNTSPVQFQQDIRLTNYGDGPWDLRITARFDDREDDDIYESITWDGYSLITEAKFSYPHTALVALSLSAEHVGSSMPTRHYHIKGRRILVPTNYNPETRVYSGVWNGAFKTAWTNNPAWIFYDLVRNNRFGLGNDVPASIADKWQLYTIAQYSDQLVPSGYKNAQGGDVMEPRYTFNGAITDKKQALEALRAITAVWRGMGFYSKSQFFVTADMPQDVAHIYGPANVVDGRFEYSNSSAKARHSVIMVRFNDANNFFEPAIEVVIDDEMVQKFGWVEKTLELAGCSSRSLARRYGKWALDTEKNEVETVSFTVGMDSIHALPGEIIAINDPRRAEVKASGRIASISGTSVIFDRALTNTINRTGATIYIHRQDGTIFNATATLNANFKQMVVGAAANTITVGDTFVLSATNVAPPQYRIVSIDERDEGQTYQITALEFDRNKFARIEQGIVFDPLPVRPDVSNVGKVTGLSATARSYVDGGAVRSDINLKWTPPESTLVREYVVTVDTPEAAGVRVGATDRNSITYSTSEPGQHTFKVRTLNQAGRASGPATVSYVVDGDVDLGVGVIEDLVNAVTGTAGGQFTGPDARIRWKNMMTVSSDPTKPRVDSDPARYGSSTVKVYSGTTLLRERSLRGNSFTYSLEMNRVDSAAKGFSSPRRALRFEVTLTSKAGGVSLPATISLTNPAPAAIAPAIEVDENYFDISWPAQSDRDIEGYLVYVLRNGGEPVAGLEPTKIVSGNSTRYKAVSLTNYWISVVGYDAFGRDALNYATPVLVRSGFDGVDDDPPEVPTGLTMSGVINPETLLVDVTATWNPSRADDFRQFQFELFLDGFAHLLETEDPTATFTLAQGTAVSTRVRAMDHTFNWSNWSRAFDYVAPVDNTPPATPANFAIQPGWGAFVLKWDQNTEADLARYEVWEGTASATLTDATPATHQALSNLFTISGYATGERRYFAVRAVDLGGNPSPWTEVKTAVTTSLSVITLPKPAAPTLASTLTALGAEVSVSWTAVEGADLYDIEVTAGANPVTQPVVGTAFKFTVLPGAPVSVRVRAATRMGDKSDWSDATPHTAIKDTAAPGQTVGVNGTPGIKMAVLKWTASTATDLARYEIYQSTSTTAPTVNTTPTYRSGSTSLIIGGLADKTLYRFWVRAVDTSENKGAWSTRVDVTTTTVDGMIADAISNATWAADLGFIKPYVGPTLPTTNIGKTLEWNGKLYTWNGTAYTSAADFSGITFEDVNGQIAAGQLTDGMLTADKIADKTLTANEIADETLTADQVAKGTFTAEEMAKGTLTAEEMAKGTLTADEIKKGTLTAAEMAKGTLTAQEMAKGTLTAEELANGAVTPDKISESLDLFIKAQGVSAAADKAAAEAAKLAAEGHAAAAKGYSDAAQIVKNNVEGRYSEITQTAGVVAAAKQTSILASGNARFQHGLDGWVQNGGRLTDLSEYLVGAVAPVWIFDPSKNVHHGVGITFARSAASTVTIDGVSYPIPANTPRYFVENGVRSLRITSTETIRPAAAIGTVDVRITYRTSNPVIQKGVVVGTSWWPGNGDFLSIVAYPAGTL
ncbi:TipJ family phage tail tip protein [Paracoccus litorisediminis]|uniref:Fibronectin type-III domain-containing protein n=1 Tax=Paracoccus litorisediminis TaxID=2006130 RepID=A0A844HMR6_9RHOB|nr:phage tail protein [Paracoccus litorisediminis]MTH61210.1 hypothetical protein [Paracoccus litorisediminis]